MKELTERTTIVDPCLEHLANLNRYELANMVKQLRGQLSEALRERDSLERRLDDVTDANIASNRLIAAARAVCHSAAMCIGAFDLLSDIEALRSELMQARRKLEDRSIVI